MPSMVHAPLITPTGYFKEKTGDHLASAFTAVNGRNSPPSPQSPFRPPSAIRPTTPPRLNGTNGMTANTTHVRPLSRHSPERPQDSKVRLPTRDSWSPTRPALETTTEHSHQNGHQNRHTPTSPALSNQESSPTSPNKRKRAGSDEDRRPYHSPGGAPGPRRRLNSYPPMTRADSPNTVAQVQQLTMEHSQPRTLPPVESIDTERTWAASHEQSHNSFHEPQHRDISRTMDFDMNHNSTTQAQMDAIDASNGFERSSTTEMTRAGVQVDPKKRKRQFANRTKTGCGTCRRRKKKCDEAKPECQNCQRGGFICEGYANKVPWPKNGTPKSHPPLQAKDRFPSDPTQLYHSHSAPREGYTDSNSPNGTDGARCRPIVVEEHDRPHTRSNWTNGWSDPPARSTYSQDQHPHPDYAQPPPSSTHGRPSSSEQHVPPSTQAPPPVRQHGSRIYHHTPQTMRDNLNHGPPVSAELPVHHQSQQSHQPLMGPLTTGPPGPPPTHYAPPPPPRPEKSEKAKMMSGEPFLPFDRQLAGERNKCKGAVYHYNNTNNPECKISEEEVRRLFNAILAARWTQAYHGIPPCGHLGIEVCVDTPFMCDYGYNIHIGNNVDIGTNCRFLDSGEITIGRNSSIGANVTIDTVKTPTETKATKGTRRTAVAAKVHIGDNVHIGANCTILAGVSIGTGAIIHPGSVVVRDIPSNCIARGNPADYV